MSREARTFVSEVARCHVSADVLGVFLRFLVVVVPRLCIFYMSTFYSLVGPGRMVTVLCELQVVL